MQNYVKVVVYPWPSYPFNEIVALSDGCGGQLDKCDKGMDPGDILKLKPYSFKQYMNGHGALP